MSRPIMLADPPDGLPPGHAGDPCPKCAPLGHFNIIDYVRPADVRINTVCNGCPPEEHLHLSCDKCGYTVRSLTADAPIPLAPLAVAAPAETESQVAPPPSQQQAQTQADTGRSAKPRGG